MWERCRHFRGLPCRISHWKGLLPGGALESTAFGTTGKQSQCLRWEVQQKECVLKAWEWGPEGWRAGVQAPGLWEGATSANSESEFPGGAGSKEPACQCRRRKRCWFNPWVKKVPWRRKWQLILVFLPGKSHGQRSYSQWGHKELDMTKRLTLIPGRQLSNI